MTRHSHGYVDVSRRSTSPQIPVGTVEQRSLTPETAATIGNSESRIRAFEVRRCIDFIEDEIPSGGYE